MKREDVEPEEEQHEWADVEPEEEQHEWADVEPKEEQLEWADSWLARGHWELEGIEGWELEGREGWELEGMEAWELGGTEDRELEETEDWALHYEDYVLKYAYPYTFTVKVGNQKDAPWGAGIYTNPIKYFLRSDGYTFNSKPAVGKRTHWYKNLHMSRGDALSFPLEFLKAKPWVSNADHLLVVITMFEGFEKLFLKAEINKGQWVTLKRKAGWFLD